MAEISGLKLIRHNRRRIDRPDDPNYPYKLEAHFRPEWGLDAGVVVMMGGREELVVRAKTVDALREFVKRNGYANHPRLLLLRLSGPHSDIEMK